MTNTRTLLASMLLISSLAAASPPRERTLFNENWRFQKGDPKETGGSLNYFNNFAVKEAVIASSTAAGVTDAQRKLGDNTPYAFAHFDDASWRKVSLPTTGASKGRLTKNWLARPANCLGRAPAGIGKHSRSLPLMPGGNSIWILTGPCPIRRCGATGSSSAAGRIVSNWKREGQKLTMEVTIPANTTATVYVPAKEASGVTESGKPVNQAQGVNFLRMENGAAVFAVGSGTYRFQSVLTER